MIPLLAALEDLFWGTRDRFARRQIAILAVWAFVVALFVWIPGKDLLKPDESDLLGTVSSADRIILELRWPEENPTGPDEAQFGSGLIGVEWSPITTTAGSLVSKRLSVNPAWSVVFRRWYMDSGLAPGDRITILSSGSFPGLAISSLAAAESMKLDITLMASLGSSSWGANTLSMPISEIFRVLRSRGLLQTRPIAYTLGGGGDTGGGIEPEAVEALLRSASVDKVPILKEENIEGMIRKKSEVALLPGTKLLVHIGGNNSDLGTDPSALDLPPGLIVPGTVKNPGNGVVAEALSAGIPVLHILNIPLLARRAGITSDPAPPWKRSPVRLIAAASAGALLLWKYRRWGFEG